MLKDLQKKLFPFIIALSALAVSASAAFYSVSGLSKLFAGAAFAVIVMAASLEVAKLVIASLLYQYRKTLPKILKYYLSIACFILILITSMGIYGFLSAAYQETASKAGNIDAQISLIEIKRDNIKDQLVVYNEEKTSINSAVADLRSGLSNNKIQYTDTSGNIVTTTSSSTRRALEKQLDQAINRQTVINDKVDILNEKLFNYETEVVEVSTNNDIAGELGPLKYLSGLTGIPMDRIINYLLLTIIFVFDPLAIALVIAANFAFGQISHTNYIPKPIKIRQSKPTQIIKKEKKEKDNLEDAINNYFETDKLNTPPDDEKRMDIIGQNGNDGLHYDELDLNKDGVIDKNERELAINSLKDEITQTKLKGDDNRVDILKRRLQGLLSIFKK
tara:strand:+ start:501 stop:1670 length:1170 start_codon:yes stop_codon:yes gene_type:complete